MWRGDDLDDIGDSEREYEEREEGDDDRLELRLLLLLRLRLCLDGDRSLGSGTLSYYRQPHSSSRDSPEQSHHIVSNPYTDSSTTNRAHEQIAQLLWGIHPYPAIPPVTSRPVLTLCQSP